MAKAKQAEKIPDDFNLSEDFISTKENVPKKRAPNPKGLREDLAVKKAEFETKGWTFEPDGECLYAAVFDENSVLGLKNIPSVETLFEFIALIESAKSDGWKFGQDGNRQFFAEKGIELVGYFPHISELLSELGKNVSEIEPPKKEVESAGFRIPLDSSAGIFVHQNFQLIKEKGWQINPFGKDVNVLSFPDGVNPKQIESEFEKLLNDLGWKSQTQLHRERLQASEPAAEAETETAKADSPQKDPLPTTVIISCRVELSDSEILEKAYSLRHAQQQLTDEISRFEREKDIHKSNVKAINSRIETFGHAIDSKSEYRDLECSLEYDFEREAVVTIRPDTGEVVKRRGMTAKELQRRLF